MKQTGPYLLVAAIGLAVLGGACGSTAKTTAPTTTSTPTSTTTSTTSVPASSNSATPPGTGSRKSVTSCLRAHGVPAARFAEALGRTTATTTVSADVSDQTLRAAGLACQSALTPTLASAVQQLDTCIAAHNIATAHSGSPLVDILLLDPTSPAVQTALSACLPTRTKN